MPEEIVLNCDCEILAVKISEPTKLHIVSVYRPLSTPICKFTDELLHIISKLKETPTCIVGDFNEDISMTCQRHCSSMLTLIEFKQMVKKNLHRVCKAKLPLMRNRIFPFGNTLSLWKTAKSEHIFT